MRARRQSLPKIADAAGFPASVANGWFTHGLILPDRDDYVPEAGTGRGKARLLGRDTGMTVAMAGAAWRFGVDPRAALALGDVFVHGSARDLGLVEHPDGWSIDTAGNIARDAVRQLGRPYDGGHTVLAYFGPRRFYLLRVPFSFDFPPVALLGWAAADGSAGDGFTLVNLGPVFDRVAALYPEDAA